LAFKGNQSIREVENMKLSTALMLGSQIMDYYEEMKNSIEDSGKKIKMGTNLKNNFNKGKK